MTKLPDIGTTMYSVHEHLYYDKSRQTAPLKEFCICSGIVKDYIEGRYAEIVVVGKDPDGYMTPWYYKASEIGKKVFYTESEAVRLAEQKTDEHERKWGWADGELRRPWREE